MFAATGAALGQMRILAIHVALIADVTLMVQKIRSVAYIRRAGAWTMNNLTMDKKKG